MFINSTKGSGELQPTVRQQKSTYLSVDSAKLITAYLFLVAVGYNTLLLFMLLLLEVEVQLCFDGHLSPCFL